MIKTPEKFTLNSDQAGEDVSHDIETSSQVPPVDDTNNTGTNTEPNTPNISTNTEQENTNTDNTPMNNARDSSNSTRTRNPPQWMKDFYV